MPQDVVNKHMTGFAENDQVLFGAVLPVSVNVVDVKLPLLEGGATDFALIAGTFPDRSASSPVHRLPGPISLPFQEAFLTQAFAISGVQPSLLRTRAFRMLR